MESTDLVAAVTLPELAEGLAVASKLGRYLPGWISEQHPDVTSLMFSLQWVLTTHMPGDSGEPIGIIYDKATHYFFVEGETEMPEEEELDKMLAYDFCPFCGRDNRGYDECTSDDCPGVMMRNGNRFFRAVTVGPSGRLTFHGIQVGA